MSIAFLGWILLNNEDKNKSEELGLIKIQQYEVVF